MKNVTSLMEQIKPFRWSVAADKLHKVKDGEWHTYVLRTDNAGFPAGTAVEACRENGEILFRLGTEIRRHPGDRWFLIGIECREEDACPLPIELFLPA